MTTLSKIKEELMPLEITLVAGNVNSETPVDYVTILELPEKTNRFKERGLVLATFQSFDGTPQIKEQISWLKAIGIVGIGFHTAHYKSVPEEIISHAGNLNMPLFSIPVDVPYHKILDIFNQLENDDLNLKNYELYRINEKMMEPVYREKDSGYIVNLMGNYIKKNIILLDSYLKVKAIWKEPTFPQAVMDNLTLRITSVYKQDLLQTRFFKRESKLTIDTFNNSKETLAIVPLTSKNSFLGYLLVNSETMEDFYHKEVIRLGIRAISLNSNRLPVSKHHNKMKDISKFEALINNVSENISMSDFYLNINSIRFCVRMKFSETDIMRNALQSLNEIFLEKHSNSLIWIFDGTLIAFLENSEEIDELMEVTNLYNDKSIGISSEFSNTSLKDLQVMNRQAITAMEYSINNGLNHVAWNELGIERIAYNIIDTDLFHSLDKDLLGELIDYDAKKNSQLMITLECCLKHFFNLKAVGEDLFIHPNTVKYRLEQINNILNFDIREYSNYALLVIAFIIYKQKNSE